MKKGLRLDKKALKGVEGGADLCPDEEGIKTRLVSQRTAAFLRGPLP